jgi:hypothetical protein
LQGILAQQKTTTQVMRYAAGILVHNRKGIAQNGEGVARLAQGQTAAKAKAEEDSKMAASERGALATQITGTGKAVGALGTKVDSNAAAAAKAVEEGFAALNTAMQAMKDSPVDMLKLAFYNPTTQKAIGISAAALFTLAYATRPQFRSLMNRVLWWTGTKLPQKLSYKLLIAAIASSVLVEKSSGGLVKVFKPVEIATSWIPGINKLTVSDKAEGAAKYAKIAYMVSIALIGLKLTGQGTRGVVAVGRSLRGTAEIAVKKSVTEAAKKAATTVAKKASTAAVVATVATLATKS